MHCVVQTEAYSNGDATVIVQVWGPFATVAAAETFASDAASYAETHPGDAYVRLPGLPHTWHVEDLRSALAFTPPDA